MGVGGKTVAESGDSYAPAPFRQRGPQGLRWLGPMLLNAECELGLALVPTQSFGPTCPQGFLG